MEPIRRVSPRAAALIVTLAPIAFGMLSGCPGPRPTTGTGAGGSGGAGGSTATGGACTGAANTDPAWANWPMPNAAGLPNAASYVISGDGKTVIDNVTHLIWERTPVHRTLATAETHCQNLNIGGVTGFRLPTVIELMSLVDTTRAKPAFDATIFPEPTTPVGAWRIYWTSAPVKSNPAYQFVLNFDDGTKVTWVKGSATWVRCVAVAPK